MVQQVASRAKIFQGRTNAQTPCALRPAGQPCQPARTHIYSSDRSIWNVPAWGSAGIAALPCQPTNVSYALTRTDCPATALPDIFAQQECELCDTYPGCQDVLNLLAVVEMSSSDTHQSAIVHRLLGTHCSQWADHSMPSMGAYQPDRPSSCRSGRFYYGKARLTSSPQKHVACVVRAACVTE